MAAKRGDDELAFILKYENVAWYEKGEVRILDRRIYPIRTEFVRCKSHKAVASAIADMVTQSGGPYVAAAMGMALAAYEAKDLSEGAFHAYMEDAAYALAHARPTTSAKMGQVVRAGLEAALQAKRAGRPADEAAFQCAIAYLEDNYHSTDLMGLRLAELIPDGGVVMTQCWAETVIGTTLRALRRQGKTARFICPETRPYFQGARLTASCIADMGFDVTVITDNMPGYVMAKRRVDLFTSAADVICMDGHIVNKVGTFQIALCAWYHRVPYFVTGIPGKAHPVIDTVRIEERDPELVLCAMDVKVTRSGVKGYYPAFDVTPPGLCAGVVTDRGIFAPRDLASYYAPEDAPIG